MRVYRYTSPLGAQSLVQDISGLLDGGFTFSTRLPGLHYNFQGSIKGDLSELFGIYQTSIGERLLVFDSWMNLVWDGLIWEVELSFGGISLGPRSISQIGNYVAVEYADILDDRRYALTAYLSDTDSQAKYGIIEQVLPYGNMTSVAADKAVAKYLANHKEPPLGGNFQFPVNSSEASLSITALGFWATANLRKFQRIDTTTDTVNNIINSIVNRTVVPNAPASSYYLQYFSTDTSLVGGTNLTIAKFNDHVDSIGAYLAHIVSLGDNSNNVWYIGAEAGSFNGGFPVGLPRMRVWQRPTAPDFVLNIAKGLIYQQGSIVSPFTIKAGSMVKIQDLSPGNPESTALDNLRNFVVAETTYNSNTDTISLIPEGSDVEIEMILARMRG